MAFNAKCRNLSKNQLGGVIFGCKKDTMMECTAKQLFGLPANHISYVKNIEPGLPLFLFNYSERKLYGIYEAVSSGKMYINSYAWTANGSEKTKYPAQVQVRVRLECQGLAEYLFKPIIIDNYYSQRHFFFELDHVQATKLESKFSSISIPAWECGQKNPLNLTETEIMNKSPVRILIKGNMSCAFPPPLIDEFTNSDDSSRTLGNSDDSIYLDENNQLTEAFLANQIAELDEKELIHEKLKELSLLNQYSGETVMGKIGEAVSPKKVKCEVYEYAASTSGNRNYEIPFSSFDSSTIIAQLCEEMEELRAFKLEQTLKMGYLEQKLAMADLEIQRLQNRCTRLEPLHDSCLKLSGDKTPIESQDNFHLDLCNLIFLVGGYNGVTWSSNLHSFSPSDDVIRSLKPMSSVRSYMSVSKLNNELYVVGGGNGSVLYDTVESYNPVKDDWTQHPPLIRKKGNLASVTLNGKLFAVGGGNGSDCFSDVEMLDLDVGRWIPARSMFHKRFSVAAAELNGALYAVGGYNGIDYLTSAERFDPREHSWTRIGSMNVKRGCHSLVVMNEKLYAIGGYNGTEMVPSVEIYDPRVGTWMNGPPMNEERGYLAAAVVKDSIYVIGGVKGNEEISNKIERYQEEEKGWEVTDLKAVREVCFASAIVLQE